MIDYVYENVEKYNPTKKRRVILVFDYIIADMESNKILTPIVIKLFLRAKKKNVLLVFISQSYFKLPKTVRLNATHHFIMKIPKKR